MAGPRGAVLGAIVKNYHVGKGNPGVVFLGRVLKKDGVAAFKNWKAKPVHSCGTGIYRKKIDTQKVYIKVRTAALARRVAGLGAGPLLWLLGDPAFPSGLPPQY